MRIGLVTLDGDGTLWDFESAMLHALAHAANLMTSWDLRVDGQLPTAAELLRDRDEVGHRHHGQGLTMERLRWLAFERSLARAGVSGRPDLIQSLYEHFMDLRHDGVRLFADALPSLAALRESCKLALITNGNTDLQRLGLEGTFDLVLSAQSCHLWKPDPRIFHLAVAELGCQTAQSLHAGDHQRDDVQGAQAAGLRSVWVNRTSARKEVWCQPDAEIPSLLDLPSALNRLR